MRIVRDFPHKVVVHENMWIGLDDGTRLAARVWLPEDVGREGVPAILEYIPYRKRDSMRSRDTQIYTYFAGHGYAGVRVDIRGSGDSGGVLEDEYLARELEDGLAILRWLEKQPWCNGRVGIMGISWGGFNGLQLASMRPRQLGAIITACSTDDRFADDVHRMGGCLLGDNLSWASTMFAYNSCPPDPAIVGDCWRDMWLERLEGSGLWLEKWLGHQRRDEYWKHGSVCEDFSAITCPVMAVSGWADGYSNAVFRLLAGLDVPRRGLIGPWGHKYPHLGTPGPAVGFLQEAVRWWDTWLKGVRTGIMDEPMLRVWMQESVPPTTQYCYRPGRWVGVDGWPSSAVVTEKYCLTPGRMLVRADQADKEAHPVQSPLGLGLFAGKWCSYADAPDLPHDQRQEDGGALVYDSPPLDVPLEILGEPVMVLDIGSNRPVAMLAVRLSDIRSDQQTTRITYGLLNLTHRDGSERPVPLVPGERYRVRIHLNHIAHRFPAGHRMRIAISTSYWPLAWPAPGPAQVVVHTGSSGILLPVFQNTGNGDRRLRDLGSPEAAPPLRMETLRPEEHNWSVLRDLAADVSTLKVINDNGVKQIREIDLELGRSAREWYVYTGNDFNSVMGKTVCERRFRRKDWNVRTRTQTVLTSTRTDFHIRAELDAYEEDARVFSENWIVTIPRDLV
ncbi:CocE/NonD family hydrolase [Desulfoplanes sp.]